VHHGIVISIKDAFDEGTLDSTILKAFIYNAF